VATSTEGAFFVWPLEGDEQPPAVLLDDIASYVTYLGRASSPAVVSFWVGKAPDPSRLDVWRPASEAEETDVELRVANKETLASLRHERELQVRSHFIQRIEISLDNVAYVQDGAARAAQRASVSWVAYRCKEGGAIRGPRVGPALTALADNLGIACERVFPVLDTRSRVGDGHLIGALVATNELDLLSRANLTARPVVGAKLGDDTLQFSVDNEPTGLLRRAPRRFDSASTRWTTITPLFVRSNSGFHKALEKGLHERFGDVTKNIRLRSAAALPMLERGSHEQDGWWAYANIEFAHAVRGPLVLSTLLPTPTAGNELGGHCIAHGEETR
jgi:hypothetical protein